MSEDAIAKLMADTQQADAAHEKQAREAADAADRARGIEKEIPVDKYDLTECPVIHVFEDGRPVINKTDGKIRLKPGQSEDWYRKKHAEWTKEQWKKKAERPSDRDRARSEEPGGVAGSSPEGDGGNPDQEPPRGSSCAESLLVGLDSAYDAAEFPEGAPNPFFRARIRELGAQLPPSLLPAWLELPIVGLVCLVPLALNVRAQRNLLRKAAEMFQGLSQEEMEAMVRQWQAQQQAQAAQAGADSSGLTIFTQT